MRSSYDHRIFGYAFAIFRRSRAVRLLGLVSAALVLPPVVSALDTGWLPLTTLILPLVLLIGTSRVEASLVLAADGAARWEERSVEEAWRMGAPLMWRVFALQVIQFAAGYLLGVIPGDPPELAALGFGLLLLQIPLPVVIGFAVRATVLHGQGPRQALLTGASLLGNHLGTIIWFLLGLAGRTLLIGLALVLVCGLPLFALGFNWAAGPGSPLGTPSSGNEIVIRGLISWLLLVLVGWPLGAWMSTTTTVFYRQLVGAPAPTIRLSGPGPVEVERPTTQL